MEADILRLSDQIGQGSQRVASGRHQRFVVVHKEEIVRAGPLLRIAQLLDGEICAAEHPRIQLAFQLLHALLEHWWRASIGEEVRITEVVQQVSAEVYQRELCLLRGIAPLQLVDPAAQQARLARLAIAEGEEMRPSGDQVNENGIKLEFFETNRHACRLIVRWRWQLASWHQRR